MIGTPRLMFTNGNAAERADPLNVAYVHVHDKCYGEINIKSNSKHVWLISAGLWGRSVLCVSFYSLSLANPIPEMYNLRPNYPLVLTVI